MKALIHLPAAVVLALAPLASFAQQAPAVLGAPGPAHYRVVMQVSNAEPRGWHQALSNALALSRNAGKANVQIEIVANGMGLGMLKYNSTESREVAAVLEQGIKVVACGETMKSLMLEKDDMLPDIGYVPGGLIEILDRQREGWQYIKAD